MSEGSPNRQEFILPHDDAAERAVLSGILVENAAIHRALGAVTGADFYRDPHRRIFNAMVGLSESGTAIDPVTVANALERAGDLQAVGGMAAVTDLLDGVPTSSHHEYYLRIVSEKARDRAALHASERFQQAFAGRNGAGPGEAREGIRRAVTDLVRTLESMERPVVAPADLTALLTEPVRPVVTLVEGLIEAGAASLGSGPPKSFKSTAAIAMGLAVASGTDFAGHFKTVKAPFLHIDAEMGIRRTLTLYRRLAVAEGIDLIGLAREGSLHYLDATRPGPGRDPRAWARIVRERRIGLVLLDPAVALFSGEENSATEVRTWWNTHVGPLIDEGAGVEIVHHTRKGSAHIEDSAADSARGSGDWRGAPDLHFGIRAAPGDRRLLRVEVTGSRLGPEPAPFYLRVEDHEGGQRIRWAGEAQEAVGKGIAIADAIVALLERAGDGEMPRQAIIETLSQSDYAERTIEDSLSLLKKRGLVDTRKQGKGTFYRRLRP